VDEIRLRRVEGELREIIAELILSGQVKDPRVGPFVSVTRVEAARDLSAAKVFVSVFPGTVYPKAAAPEGATAPEATAAPEGGAADQDEKVLSLAVEGLHNAAGFIQAQLARRMKTRLTPRLTFLADKGIKEGFELTERMKGLFS
jgi:ribosome-binding factor A